MKQYQQELEQHRAAKRIKKKDNTTPDPEHPQKPKFKVLYVSANSSSAAVIGHLEQSECIGISSETEVDTIGNSFKVQPHWRDVSPQSKVNLTEFFSKQSEQVDVMANYVEHCPTEFHLITEQCQFLNSRFDLWLQEVSTFVSEDASSTVKRLTLIVFRIAMVLSAIRKLEDGVADQDITCEDTDFQTAFALAEVYKQHALLLCTALPKSEVNQLDQNKNASTMLCLPTGSSPVRKRWKLD